MATDEAATWVDFLLDQLEAGGRPIEGGWPGTLSEARRRLMMRLARESGSAGLDREALTELVNLVYATAKQRWLRVSRG